MSIIFDGKTFASRKELELKKKVNLLKKQRIIPKMVTFVDMDNEAAVKYTTLKQKSAERIGAEIEVYKINKLRGLNPLIQSIKLLNQDPEVHGIMVQLPLPKSMRPFESKILNEINSKKDVDGLSDKSSFVSATVRAIQLVLNEAGVEKRDGIVVLGSKGEVGKRLVKYLSFKGYSVRGFDKGEKNIESLCKKANVIISATGQAKLVTLPMIKNQAVVIDVGYSSGDVDFETVASLCRFITPVPGGVGPVTVVSLLENLVEAATKLG